MERRSQPRHDRFLDADRAAATAGKRTLVQARYAPRGGAAPAPAADAAASAPVPWQSAVDAVFSLHLGDAVQRREAAIDPDADAAHTLSIARAGVAGPGGALPHGDTIQRAFGDAHDLSGVRAHVGGTAAQAAGAIGAMAYATGHDIAFADEPDLFTAAHEAAHVVQQRHGVALRGGVGAAGDAYEREADRVAEAVVAGRSAAPLLAGYGAGAGATAVQRRDDGPDLRPGELALQRILTSGTLAEVTAMVAALKLAKSKRGKGVAAIGGEELPPEPDQVSLTVAGAAASYDVAPRSTNRMITVGTARIAELSGAPPDPKWVAFAEAFNEHFGSVSHAFALTDEAKHGTAAEVASIRLQYLFVPEQRDLLMGYFATNLIPEGLFNGQLIGRTTAQQRIILSSKILAEGKYRPGSFDQRVHALACFHWVRIVNHYAGATSRGLGQGLTGNFDHAGHVVLATGKTETEFQSKRDPDLEIPEGTSQDKAHGDDAWRFRMAPWSTVLELEPGDWVYIYNANKSVSGAHSIIFAGWAGETKTSGGHHVREAHVFDQGDPKDGGRGRTKLLGDDFFMYEGRSVTPVNHIMRVNAEAATADTVDALTPELSTKVAKKNHDFVRKLVKRAKGGKHEFDVEAMNRWLKAQSVPLIRRVASVPGRLDPEQTALLMSAADSTDNHTLVCLFQRMFELEANSAALARNTETANGKLDPVHATAAAERDERQRLLKEQTDPLEAELAELSKQRGPIEDRLAEIDNSGVITELRQQVRATATMRAALPEDYVDARAYLRKFERGLIEQILDQKAVRATHKQELRDLKKQLRPITKRERSLDAKLDRLREKAAKEDPTRELFALTHGGSRKDTEKETIDGRYDHLPGEIEWSTFLRPVASGG